MDRPDGPPGTARRDVVMLVTGLDYGGAERQASELARRLAGRGWRVGVVSMLPPRAFADELEAAGVPVVTLGMARGVPDPRALVRLAGVLGRWRPLVLHSHMVHANLLGRLVRLVRWAPVQISTAHSVDEGARWRELAYRLTDPLCSLTTNVAEAAVERYVRVGAAPAGRIEHVPNGVDTDRFRPDPEARRRVRDEWGDGAFWWLAVGRFEKQKDYPTLLRAFARVRTGHPEARLAIAGAGPLRPDIEALAAEVGVAPSVRFLGLRTDVPALMAAADAYVMSSAWEGLPLVLLEAAASGLPVVTTDAGGTAEVLDSRRLVVPPRSPEALAGAMSAVYDMSAADRAALGLQNRAHVEATYSLDAVVTRWEGIYRRLLGGRGPKPGVEDRPGVTV